ncbi:substrate-binding domain-containing protein [Clostridium sp. Marseille-P2415]|uniref:substrate-binding domain-containing protein n=1 Tax=Clostridium sp. Marseille-P2415 TaxID=1805471 RepID=UPI00098875E2|nr:substrate-binding domain-containing protein [Clostridium sp. Marseille-P2415]
MKKKNITFEDIAKYTNFSKTTISRYFNNPDSLTLENQEIIAKALIDLDYKENKVAKILASGKTEFVGIIIPNLYLHYYSEMLNQILSTYKTYGYKFLVFTGSSNGDIEHQYIQELLAYKIEGMIVLSHTISSKELASYNIPIVTIEREDKYTCSVNTDNYMGGVQAASLLYKNNCDILIHVNVDVPPEIPAYGRIKGFLDICREHQLPHELLLKDLGDTYRDNLNCIREIAEYLDQNYSGKKKGVFLANDTYANMMVNSLIRKHGSLPDDYRIIGFDNSPISGEAVIPTSTVGQQIDKIANAAMELLVAQMNERKKRKPIPLETVIHKVIPPVLISRETSDPF